VIPYGTRVPVAVRLIVAQCAILRLLYFIRITCVVITGAGLCRSVVSLKNHPTTSIDISK